MTQEVALKLLTERLAYARMVHPVFARSKWGALWAIGSEVFELIRAIVMFEGATRILDEARDVAATAMRLVMGEVEK